MAAATAEIFEPRYSQCATDEFRQRARRRPAIPFDEKRQSPDSLMRAGIRALPAVSED